MSKNKPRKMLSFDADKARDTLKDMKTKITIDLDKMKEGWFGQ
jgi:hypothetical protein